MARGGRETKALVSLAGAVLFFNNIIAAHDPGLHALQTPPSSLTVNELKSSACSYNYEALLSSQPTPTPAQIAEVFSNTNFIIPQQRSALIQTYCSWAWGRAATATPPAAAWQSWKSSIAPEAKRLASVCADVPEKGAQFLVLAASDANSCETALRSSLAVASGGGSSEGGLAGTAASTSTSFSSTKTEGADETAEQSVAGTTTSASTAGGNHALETGRVVAVLAAVGGVLGAVGML